jgi:dTDP-4-dehydrorhamnose reductase
MFGKEPTVILNGLAEILRQVIPMLILFGILHWTDQQIAAVFMVVSAVVAFLSTAWARSQVVPHETANAQIETAIKMPKDSTLQQVIDKTEAQKS